MNTVNRQPDDPETILDQRGYDRTPLHRLHAIEEAARLAGYIASDELFDMAESADTSDIPEKELHGFLWADIVMEAIHRDTDETQYIAVEAAYTANRFQADRAIRNAGLLARFTGHPAHAVIVAQRITPNVETLVENGAVQWAKELDRIRCSTRRAQD